MVYVIACVAAIAGLLFGYDEGIIGRALPSLQAEFQMPPAELTLMAATVPLGALAGAIIGGSLTAPWGRRSLLICAALLFCVGAIICAMAPHVPYLSIGRFFLGVAIGVAAMTAPLYISERAPHAKRGMLVSIYPLAITLGFLAAYVVGFALHESWRLMFYTAVVPGVLLLVGAWRLSDTPRWLVMSGRRQEAAQVIARTRRCAPNDAGVVRDLSAIDYAARTAETSGSWGDLFGPLVRPAFGVAIGLFVFQQLSGISAVIYFAPTIFAHAGFESPGSRLLATLGIGAVNVVMTVVAMALVDRIGRRKLLFIGFSGAAVSLALMVVAAIIETEGPQWLALFGLGLYMASFGIAIGPLPWVIMSEVFPLNLRGPGMGAASMANWACNFLVLVTFPVLLDGIDLGGVFAIYALACVLALFFTARHVPETCGLTLEEIEAHLRAGKPFRTLAPAGRLAKA